MATQSVPYNTAMRLGSGFNSFTQTLCIDRAVIQDEVLREKVEQDEPKEKDVAQSVIYKTSIVNKTSDVIDAMNVNGAFNIKYDQLTANGSGRFINLEQIKDSDVSIMVSVKVINQTIYDHALVKFQPIENIKDISSEQLIEIYGDSFISGWQEGGEFLAVISIKARNRDMAQTIAADAKVAFSSSKDPPPDSKSKDVAVNLDARFDKLKKEITAENEISVSVTWTGGGQKLKDPEQDWDFDTMKKVALKFPDLCAKTPMRTHALLTKYTALHSFHTAHPLKLPVYDKTGVYTNVLQEAYLDYKSILSSIQVLAFEVVEGRKVLAVNPQAAKAVEQTKETTAHKSEPSVDKSTKDVSPSADTEPVNGSLAKVTTVSKLQPKVVTPPSPAIEEAFPPTITGLEEARSKCRFMINRIIQEIDNIAIRPEIATDETRRTPYLSPFLFKMLLPLGVDVLPASSQVGQVIAASKIDSSALSKSLMGLAS